jgi:hypothetical protein
LKQTAFRVEDAVLDGLRAVRDRDGMPVSVQVRRALRAWLELKGVKVKAKPAARRTRAGRDDS